MFSGDIRIYGKHSVYLKKYSRDNKAGTDYEFKVSSENGKRVIYIFETMIQTFEIAAMIGIINKRSSEEDNSDRSEYATIFYDAVNRQRNNLNQIVQFMELTKEVKGTSVDATIKKAFTINKSDSVERELYGYVRYGLEEINEIFGRCNTYEDVANALLTFTEKYSIESTVGINEA